MIIGILKEEKDTRVAMTPDVCQKLTTLNNKVFIEKNAGKSAFFNDALYKKEGVEIVERVDVIKSADLLLSIDPISENELGQMKEGATYISMFAPYQDATVQEKLAKFPINAFSLDMIPRSTRAQAMDVLSSMASIAGYKAVIKAADLLPRYFPMLTTSAGSIPPAKVLILGAGVAGLQAIATARRNGAMVEAFDTRLAAKEEVESLGGKFVMVEGAKDDKDAGGYAVEQSEEYKQKQRELVAMKASKADVIITTAQLRGRPAPTLITKDMVENMQPGAVIIDLASSTGGNCELTQDNATIIHQEVSILGNSSLMSEVSMHASKLFSKNVFNFISIMLNDGALNISFEDEIVNSACVAYNKIVWDPATSKDHLPVDDPEVNDKVEA